MESARGWIERLGLSRHPEGGWFRETYRSAEGVAAVHLPPRFGGDRSFATSIYYLLESGDLSALHRIHQDEVWHFHDGSPLTLHLISSEGEYSTRHVGIGPGLEPQAVAPAGWLFAATVAEPASYCLVGCTVSPGFDFADFSMPPRAELLRAYPHLREAVERLTRG